MTDLVPYKGLQVLTTTIDSVPGGGGRGINDDFVHLVDWNPKCNWAASADPTKDDDVDDDYQVGSRWLNTTTGGLFICIDATDGAAVWRGIQYGVIGLTAWNSTDDDTPTQLFLNGSSQLIQVPQKTIWAFTVTTVARKTSSGSSANAAFEAKGAIKRDTFLNSTMVDTVDYSAWKESGASTWDLTVSASGSSLKIEATGEDSVDIDWSANVRIKPLTVP